MLKAGVIGAGHLGKIHLKLLEQSEKYELLGFYDTDTKSAKALEHSEGYTAFESLEALIAAVDVVDIVALTLAHFDLAKQVIAAGKHFFIEKPITQTLEEAKTLTALAAAQGCMGQVGHVERFNPAFKAGLITNPMFIETHRLANSTLVAQMFP